MNAFDYILYLMTKKNVMKQKEIIRKRANDYFGSSTLKENCIILQQILVKEFL